MKIVIEMNKIVCVLVFLLSVCSSIKAQEKIECEVVLKKAHHNLGELYAVSTDSSGYLLKVLVESEFTNKDLPKIPGGKFVLAATKNEFYYESEKFDYFQNEDYGVKVFKNEKLIYINENRFQDQTVEFMRKFRSLQHDLPGLLKVTGCTSLKGTSLIKIETEIARDSITVKDVARIDYVIDSSIQQIKDMTIWFKPNHQLKNYRVKYEKVMAPYSFSEELRDKFSALTKGELDTYPQYTDFKFHDGRVKK